MTTLQAAQRGVQEARLCRSTGQPPERPKWVAPPQFDPWTNNPCELIGWGNKHSQWNDNEYRDHPGNPNRWIDEDDDSYEGRKRNLATRPAGKHEPSRPQKKERTMVRDLDLCRQILFAIEAADSFVRSEQLEIDGYEKDAIIYNCVVLTDTDLVIVHDKMFGDHPVGPVIFSRLTNVGHDFVDLSRKSTLWEKAKAKIASAGSALTLQVAIAVLRDLSLSALHGPQSDP